jgi:inhibitor of KinA
MASRAHRPGRAPARNAPTAGRPRPRYLPVGEQGLTVELGDTVDEEVNARVQLLATAVARQLAPDVEEVVPTYRSLLLLFDPLRVKRSLLIRRVEKILAALPERAALRRPRVVHIPVCYGGELGPDLDFVAQHSGLSAQEVVAVHEGAPYRVYMLGFTPGFPYLGGMSPRIAAPRLERPRPRIPAGTVGIAGEQTGIYPVESPGGWRLIGRTPVRLFDWTRREPFLVRAGDVLRFHAIQGDEFHDVERRISEGQFVAEIEPAEDGA